MSCTVPITQGISADVRYRVAVFLRVRHSGRLPYTIGRSINDYGAQINRAFSLATTQIPYTEGLNIDYRYFDVVRLCLLTFLVPQY
jgi:hypothetical protein